jgi:hypothetical protein
MLPFGSLSAQEIPEKELPKPAATLTSDIESVRGVHELKDGRVLIVEGRAQKLLLGDFATGKVTMRMETGPEDNQFRTLMGLWAWPGDSVASIDPVKARMMIFGPDGTMARTVKMGEPMTQQFGAPAGRGGDAAAAPAGGAPGPRGPRMPQLRYLVGTQTAFGTGFPQRGAPTPPTVPPPRAPFPIVRYNLQSLTYDTVTQLMPAQAPRQPLLNPTLATYTAYIGTQPLQAVDTWTVLSDGTVAVVRGASYKIDLFAPDGTRSQVGPVPYTPIPVSKDDKKRLIDEYKGNVGQMLRTNPRAANGATVGFEEPTSWPDNNPPFRADIAPHVDRQDRIWLATRCAKDDQARCYDVIDRTGARVARYRLPPKTSIVAFGAGSVYTVSQAKDKDALQRHVLTP